MPKPVTIIANAVKAKLLNADRETRLAVMDKLSFVVEGHEHSDSFKTGHWDGRSSFYEFATDAFPAGFVSAIETFLSNEGHRVFVKRKTRPAPLGIEVDAAYAAVNPFPVSEKYDYQPETVRRLLRHGQMVAQVATGGGKSIIAATAVKAIMRPTLFLTTRQVLMYQMKTGFETAGFKVGVMGDGEWAPKRGVNVATVQTIQARLGNMKTRTQTEKLLGLFELAILEEAHEAGGQGYYDVMNSMPNAHYRLALTATPFMRDDGESNMRLMAVSGQIGIKVSEKLLIERGILARPIFKYGKAAPPPELTRGACWQKAYDLGIVNNAARNAQIVDHVTRAVSHGLPAMVLVQRKAHGEALKKQLAAAELRVEFIYGGTDQDRRQRALNKLRSGEIDVLIGSTILDVGVDVPAVGMVVLAGGGKAEIALRQRIGRGLRAKSDGPNICLVLDFNDTKNKHLIKHYRERRKIIETTPGFAENILSDGADFPYAALGLRKAA